MHDAQPLRLLQAALKYSAAHKEGNSTGNSGCPIVRPASLDRLRAVQNGADPLMFFTLTDECTVVICR